MLDQAPRQGVVGVYEMVEDTPEWEQYYRTHVDPLKWKTDIKSFLANISFSFSGQHGSQCRIANLDAATVEWTGRFLEIDEDQDVSFHLPELPEQLILSFSVADIDVADWKNAAGGTDVRFKVILVGSTLP